MAIVTEQNNLQLTYNCIIYSKLRNQQVSCDYYMGIYTKINGTIYTGMLFGIFKLL